MDGFLASPVGWGIANIMRKTSVFQCTINIPTHRSDEFQEDKPELQGTRDEISTLYYQLHFGSIETALLKYILHIVAIEACTHIPLQQLIVLLNIWIPVRAVRSYFLIAKKHNVRWGLSFIPVSKNTFCDLGIIHSTSWAQFPPLQER